LAFTLSLLRAKFFASPRPIAPVAILSIARVAARSASALA
jgi:hypothetical protein